MDVNVRSSDVEAGDLQALSALHQGGAGNHHVGLLGHVHHVGDDGHVAAAGDAVAEDTGNLRNSGGRELAVHLEDGAGAGFAGKV